MTTKGCEENPFAVTTPENLTDSQIVKLFVDVFSDFPKIINANHTFIHGARGIGKSMMLRYLEPTVQMLAKDISQPVGLDFFAVHVPIKTSNLSKVEFSRFTGAPYYILAEHMLVLHCLVKITETLKKVCHKYCNSDEVRCLCEEFFLKKLLNKKNVLNSDECNDYFSLIINESEALYDEAQQFVARHAFTSEVGSYEGRLVGWLDFLVPFLREAKKLPFLPNSPFFLMLDDADNLQVNMQRIINTWVSTRVTDVICLKITTQMRYQTYETLSEQIIESPHDYTEIDITKLYTSKSTDFYSKAQAIISKRLSLLSPSSPIEPENFFPADLAQEKAIEGIADSLKDRHREGSGRATRAGDDVTRYARPEYIRLLGKSAHTYSYAGFKSLVDLSSGIIRWLLEPVSIMYSESTTRCDGKVLFIPPGLQDKVIKKWSLDFYEVDLKKLDSKLKCRADDLSDAAKLRNLIDAIGGLFQLILKSERLSERRIFTFMLTEDPSDELAGVLDLGVRHGYFFKSSVGSKEGYGRNSRYSLSRRLGPYFKLDVSGFAGNLSVAPSELMVALRTPDKFIRTRLNKLLGSEENTTQLSLFS